jgi:3-hydroxyisobutyrate dehydrogenase-like beta-hydroxyacid dehydrogenase
VQFVGEDISTSSGLEAALLFFTNASLVCYLQSAALLRAAGVPHGEFTKRLGAALPVLAWLAGESDKAIAAGDHRGTEATLHTYLESFRDLRAYAVRAHAPDRLIAAFADLMQAAIDAGRGHQELSALYEVLRPAAAHA